MTIETVDHPAMTGIELHELGHRQSGDPGAIGAGRVWHKTTDDTVWVRKNDNSGWVELTGGGSAHPNLATHDALGLATDAELAAHAGTANAHGTYSPVAHTHTHAATTGQTVNDHHNRDHAASHLSGGADPIALVNSAVFVIDGAGAVITTGIKGDLVIDFACNIIKWTVLADQSGSIAVALWKDTYAAYPPVVGDLIATPAIAGALKAQSGAISLAVAAGDVIRFNVNSATSIQRATIALTLQRT